MNNRSGKIKVYVRQSNQVAIEIPHEPDEVKMVPGEKELNRRLGFFEIPVKPNDNTIKKSGCVIL